MESRKIKNIIKQLEAFRAGTKLVVTMGDYVGKHKVIATYTKGELTLADGIDEAYTETILNAVADPNGLTARDGAIEAYVPLMWAHTVGLTEGACASLKTV